MKYRVFVLVVAAALFISQHMTQAAPNGGNNGNFNSIGGGVNVTPESTEDSPAAGGSEEPQPYGGGSDSSESGSGILTQGLSCVLPHTSPQHSTADSIAKALNKKIETVQNPLIELGQSFFGTDFDVQEKDYIFYGISLSSPPAAYVDKNTHPTTCKFQSKNVVPTCPAVKEKFNIMISHLECYSSVLGDILKYLTTDLVTNSSSIWGPARKLVYESYDNVTATQDMKDLVAALPCTANSTTSINCTVNYEAVNYNDISCVDNSQMCQEVSRANKMALVAAWLAAPIKNMSDNICAFQAVCLNDHEKQNKRRKRRR